MARTLLFIALCVLPALVSAARPARNPFLVQGRVFCDPCRCGFETRATTYIAGATVKVECKDRKTNDIVYTREGTTDSSGTYQISVNEDHADQACDAVVVKSSQLNCMNPSPGRDRARVILTGYNGIASNNRNANSIGFEMEAAKSGCAEILKMYQEDDE